MNLQTANILRQLNTRFYAANAVSFSQTRHAAWEGWRRCMQVCEPLENPFSVLDVACGNLRFEQFLTQAYPETDFDLHAIDNCDPLVFSTETPRSLNVAFTEVDVLEHLLENHPFFLEENPFNLAVSFGFMHHVPGFSARKNFLARSLALVKPGGKLVVSFWQFLNNESMREKIDAVNAEALAYLKECEPAFDPAELEENDYLLGWKNLPGQYRYCHHFSDEEIAALVSSLEPHAKLLDSFSADGKSGNLNRYVVLQRIR